MTRELRSHKRVIVAIDAQWAIEPLANWSHAKILDVSLLGASFQVDSTVALEPPVAFKLRADDVPVLPATADLLWSRQLTSAQALTMGVRFRAITPDWVAWVSLATGEFLDN